MPIPHFVDQEVLSALRLNALIDAANTLSLLLNSIVTPFEQVQLDDEDHAFDNHGSDRWWSYLHKFVSINRYMKLQYQFFNCAGGARIEVWINLAKVYESDVVSSDVQSVSIDLLGNDTAGAPLWLVDSSMNEFRVYMRRGDSEYCRLLKFYNTNTGTW